MDIETYLLRVLEDDVAEDGSALWCIGNTIFRDHDPCLELLDEEYRDEVFSCAGIIVDADGVATVYALPSELAAAWAALTTD